MFANIRRYRLDHGSLDELMRRVDAGFAELICSQDGFVSYHAIELPDRGVLSLTVFREPRQAEASRDHARLWMETELRGLTLRRLESMRGEIDVSRASRALLAERHAARDSEYCSLRRYLLGSGSIDDLLAVIDREVAPAIEAIDGFHGYLVLELGDGQLVTMSFFADQDGARRSEQHALAFLTCGPSPSAALIETLGGEVRVSRARTEMLVPQRV